ncbi:MAG: hypothetical protein J1E63_07705 [Muribaculaceae bacterium]|nr:hypothetical protein [Muribaculaceae bacterium]
MATKTFEKVGEMLTNLGATVKSLIKVTLKSRRPTVSKTDGGRIIILGNGPSLNDVIESNLSLLQSNDTMAVNFAANAPVFFEIKPNHYILADPHFFQSTDDLNVARLIDNLSKVTWKMTLYIPVGAKLSDVVVDNRNITIERFNFIGAEGFDSVTFKLFDAGLAMPRPRNVLIPAIMTAIRAGYREIVIVGADHSWTRTLSVDDNNTVISVQPHFYEEDKHEQNRVTAVYKDVKLHEILLSFHIAFSSYHQIARYASRRGISIINATPGSFIDAFPRSPLH